MLASKSTDVVTTEEILSPYGLNQPYELTVRVQQVKWLLKQVAQTHFPLGCILLELKEKESHEKFVSLLSEEFSGMSERSAYYYMTFAKKCIELPKLRNFAESNWSKAIALLESCSDESLKEIEEKGINGKALEDYDGYTHKEFKSLIEKLKKQVGNNPELRNIELENNQLRQERDALRLRVPNGPDASWASNMLAEIEASFMRLDSYLTSIAFDARIIGDDNMQAQVVGLHARMMDRFWRFEQRWEDYTGQKIG